MTAGLICSTTDGQSTTSQGCDEDAEKNDSTDCGSSSCSLASQDLTEIPSWFWQQQQLLPHRPSSTLTHLDLSRNRLAELPAAIFASLGNLQVLNVNRNRLRAIPPDIGKLTQLQELHALANNLRPYARSLPLNELAALPCLRLLDLRYHAKLKEPALVALQGVLEDQVEIRITLQQQQQQQQPAAAEEEKDHASHNNTNGKEHACDRDATLLRSQLEPLSTPTLRQRLKETFGITLDDNDPHSFDRNNVMNHMLEAYQRHCPNREKVHFQGRPVDPRILQPLLQKLQEWVHEQRATPRERPKIRASHYMILRSPEEFSTDHSTKQRLAAAKLQKHQALWDLAKAALSHVDPHHRFTALAVTHNFVGSPHIDTQNIGPFYGIALGDFDNGTGQLCVELNATQVAFIDTHDKFAKVDGRFVHWVAPYEPDQTRFSLIYYQTVGDVTPQTKAVLDLPAVPPNEEE
ncbi:expressed unknown protein [Seminavis robusta]|uniref:Uncharacterized protein n=1 Tax=Seminavis robusta TaxID=568900 RepID=A0A9N8H562_9STRA|nr:expressed unknown protein [Seminavis robusta]|eukprot:Sro66_g037370.1 n/a (463) ;mRNA; r:131214-132602